MKKLFAFLLSLFALASCQPDAPPPDDSDEDSITYEADSTDANDFDSLEGYNPFARTDATAKGKVTFEVMSNEGEIITKQWEKITLWYYGTTQPTIGDPGRLSKPKYTVLRPENNRSYTRKSMSAGWYMLQLDEERFAVMNVGAGSDGLFVFNDKNTTDPLFAGYYPSYGKIKFTFGSIKGTAKKPAISIKTQAFLTLTTGGNSTLLWLYADIATGTATKSMFWFMPAGTYATSYYGSNLLGDADTKTYPTLTGSITVAPGKIFPTIKL